MVSIHQISRTSLYPFSSALAISMQRIAPSFSLLYNACIDDFTQRARFMHAQIVLADAN